MRMSPFSRYLQFGTSDPPCIYHTWMTGKVMIVWKTTRVSTKRIGDPVPVSK